MLVTKNFIILNLPKTGSTFVREVVNLIYRDRISKRILFKLEEKFFGPLCYELNMPHLIYDNYTDQHGAYFQIPKNLLNRKIVSVIRSPYSRFFSQYKYGWWKNNFVLDKDILNEKFPSFPDLSIDEYIHMRILETNKLKMTYKIPKDLNIGDMTIQFIYMFFKNPPKIFSKLNEDYFLSNEFKNDIANIEFLNNENLNFELADFLSKQGFSKVECEFARNYKKVNESVMYDTTGNPLSDYAINYIKEKESFMIRILSELGIHY